MFCHFPNGQNNINKNMFISNVTVRPCGVLPSRHKRQHKQRTRNYDFGAYISTARPSQSAEDVRTKTTISTCFAVAVCSGPHANNIQKFRDGPGAQAAQRAFCRRGRSANGAPSREISHGHGLNGACFYGVFETVDFHASDLMKRLLSGRT